MNPVCPYCNSEIAPETAERVHCTVCGAAHHPECWEENRGCTVFGCAGAPPEEPKVTVVPADFQAYAAPPPPPLTRTYVPPPPPANFVSPGPGMSLGGYNPAPLPYWQPVPPYAGPPKSRTVYVLLGIFLGMFGVHNFYAGHTNKGAIQLAITLATFFMGALISWIWAIVEVCLVDRDGHNVYMV